MEYLEWKERYYIGNEEYFRNYYKKFREEIKRHCIYLIKDKEDVIKYVGSTDNMYARYFQHIGGFSSIELTPEKWEKLNLDHFEVSWIDNITKEDRLYLEYYLIEKHSENNLLNTQEPYQNKIKDISEERKIELQEIAEKLIFKIYD